FKLRTIQSLAAAIVSSTPLGRNETTSIRKHSRAEGEVCPASFAQQRLWLLDQIESSSAYNEPIVWRLTGRLDVELLRQALNRIGERHEVLRTTISSAGDQVVQVIGRPSPLAMPVIDLSHLSTEERAKAMDELIEKQTSRPFDLSRDLMIRAG